MGIKSPPCAVATAENAINTATAYIEVLGPRAALGTWLVSNLIDERFPPQMVALAKQLGDRPALQAHYYPFETRTDRLFA